MHYKPAYLDHQASTPTFDEVINAMQPFWRQLHGNPHSTEHATGWNAAKALETSRVNVANLLDVLPSEVIFTSGATEANNVAIFGLATTDIEQIVTTEIEHASVLAATKVAANERGLQLVVLGVDEDGRIRLDELRRRISLKKTLVSIGYVNNEIGSIQDLAAISKTVRAHSGLLHSDCAQAPFGADLNHITDWVDALSLSGHKMGGPMGIGALYLSQELQQSCPPRVHGGGQEGGIRCGTVPLPLAVGLGVAAGLFAEQKQLEYLKFLAKARDQFINLLLSDGVVFSLNGPKLETRHPGNLNIAILGIDAQDLILRMQPHIAISTGSACSSGEISSSHVLRAIGISDKQRRSSLRIGFGPHTTPDELEHSARLIAKTVKLVLNE